MTQRAQNLRVLVVDDERNIRTTLRMCLEADGCQVVEAESAEAARAAVMRELYDLAFVDLRLDGSSGLDLLPELLAERPRLAIVMITAYATLDTAILAIKRGARDYLPKPFTPAQIRHVVEQVQKQIEVEQRLTDLEGRLEDAVPEVELASESLKMRAVLELVERAAASDVAVLFRGESGTGKGVVARALHVKSARASRPFVVINCPTLSEDLLASELFGHARGAFTGAVRDQPGRVEGAEGGTLLLDEIGELPPALQAKLLRFLQDKEYERVGENRTRRADVRVLAATNRNLEQDVAAGRFREDLLFRLNVVEIPLPPLRERPEDILLLARRFLAFFARASRRPERQQPELSAAAERALVGYPWPGNVRELRNAIERAVMLWPARVLEPQALPERILAHQSPVPRLGGDFSLDTIEREHIERVVARTRTQEDAARVLGIDPSTIWRKRKK